MPRRISDLSPAVKPFVFHGLDLVVGSEEATGLCPFCDKEKFSVNIETGLWKCWSCGGGLERGGGDIVKFIELVWQMSVKSTTAAEYEELAANRKLKQPNSLKEWGLALSPLNDRWLIPGWSKGPHSPLQLKQLYAYSRTNDRFVLLPTPGLEHTLLGLPLYDTTKEETYVAEGIWDAIVLWEAMKGNKLNNAGLSPTANERECLLSSTNVLATPSCTVWLDGWASWFKSKDVFLVWDNDHPPNQSCVRCCNPTVWLYRYEAG